MKQNRIIKNTFKFMFSFIFITLLTFIVFAVLALFSPKHGSISDYVPIRQNFSVDSLNWESINNVGGEGLLLDENGNVLRSYNFENPKDSYSNDEILNMLMSNQDIINDAIKSSSNKTTFLYELEDNTKLLLTYPENVVSRNIVLNLNEVMENSNTFFITFLLIFVLYLIALYLLVKRLSKSLNRELELIKKEEENKKDLFFKGLAHDTKTPLASVIALSSALKDEIVPKEYLKEYYNRIYKNGNILSDRIKDMIDLTVLKDTGIFSPKSNDILEFVRRYVGENYNWFSERDTSVEIPFNDGEKYETEFDEKLFERLLQNILENSVYHNEKPVEIEIDFNKKSKKFIFSDNGKGIPNDIKDTLFEPMVTGDSSRSGENLRGIGLANVSRIADLHNWKVYYENGFILEL